MAQSHGVFLPTGSSIYYCKVKVLGKPVGTSTGCRSKQDAIAFARRWKASKIAEAQAEQAEGPQMTFLAAVKRYMDEVGDLLASRPKYDVYFDWLIARIGERTPISKIDNAMLAKLIAERARQYRFGNPKHGRVSLAYVQQSVLIPLQTVLTRARDLWDAVLPKMPVWRKHKPEFRPRTRVMSWQEEADIEVARFV